MSCSILHILKAMNSIVRETIEKATTAVKACIKALANESPAVLEING